MFGWRVEEEAKMEFTVTVNWRREDGSISTTQLGILDRLSRSFWNWVESQDPDNLLAIKIALQQIFAQMDLGDLAIGGLSNQSSALWIWRISGKSLL
jgi:hypothetical protein